MLATIITFAKSAVAKYKAQRVKNVVDSYIAVADGQLTLTFPILLESYRRVGHLIVDKTYENPAPLVAFIESLDEVIKHYGPMLKSEVELLNEALEKSGTSKVITSRISNLIADIEALSSDVS